MPGQGREARRLDEGMGAGQEEQSTSLLSVQEENFFERRRARDARPGSERFSIHSSGA